MEINIKDLATGARKIAFSIAFGWGLGKMAIDMIGCTAYGIMAGSLAALADNGNAWAQERCRDNGIKYKQKHTDSRSCDTEEKE